MSEAHIEDARFIECKFTVESDTFDGGDFEKNIGGKRRNKRITFEGFATKEMYDALMDSVREVTSE